MNENVVFDVFLSQRSPKIMFSVKCQIKIKSFRLNVHFCQNVLERSRTIRMNDSDFFSMSSNRKINVNK